jgi:predicted RecA/RadA family phage recombinase
MAARVHEGETIDYTPSSAVAVGAVVAVGSVGVGVAVRPIAANELGALAVEGVFEFPKATGAGTALTFGAKVYWDATNSVVTTTSSGNTLAGYVVVAAGTADAVVRVKLMKA